MPQKTMFSLHDFDDWSVLKTTVTKAEFKKCVIFIASNLENKDPVVEVSPKLLNNVFFKPSCMYVIYTGKAPAIANMGDATFGYYLVYISATTVDAFVQEIKNNLEKVEQDYELYNPVQ